MSADQRELGESLITNTGDAGASPYYNNMRQHGNSAASAADGQYVQVRAVVLMTLSTLVLVVLTLAVVWAAVATVIAVKNSQQQQVQPTPAKTNADDFANPSLFHFVSVNDCYELSPVSVFVNGKTQLRGGASRVSQYVKQLRSTVGSQNVLLLGGGDFVSPSLASSFFNGKQMIEALNTMQMNYTCIGNHELDFVRFGNQLKNVFMHHCSSLTYQQFLFFCHLLLVSTLCTGYWCFCWSYKGV